MTNKNRKFYIVLVSKVTLVTFVTVKMQKKKIVNIRLQVPISIHKPFKLFCQVKDTKLKHKLLDLISRWVENEQKKARKELKGLK